MPLHFDLGSKNRNSAPDLIINESGQPCEIRYHCRDLIPKSKRGNPAQYQGKKPWIPPPCKSTGIPPLNRSKDPWAYSRPRTCRDVVPHDGIRIALGDKYSMRDHEFILSNGLRIETGYPLRPSDIARGIFNMSEDICNIKDNLQEIRHIMCKQQGATDNSETTPKSEEKIVSDLEHEIKTTKQEVSQLKSKISSLECKIRKPASGKWSSVTGGSTETMVEEKKRKDIRKKAEKMALRIIKEGLKDEVIEDSTTGKSKDNAGVKTVNEVKKADGMVSSSTKNDKLDMKVLLKSLRTSRKLAEEACEEEQNLHQLCKQYADKDIEFFTKLEDVVKELQDTVDVAAGSDHTAKSNKSSVLPPNAQRSGSSTKEIAALFPDDNGNTAKSLQYIYESFLKKNKEIYLLRKHCLNLHKITDEAKGEDLDKKVLKMIDCKMVDFSKSLSESKKKGEVLKAELRSKSQELRRVYRIIEEFDSKLKKYSTCPYSIKKKYTTIETTPKNVVSEVMDGDQEQGRNEEYDSRIHRRIHEPTKIHLSQSEPLRNLIDSSSDDFATSSLSRYDDQEKSGHKISGKLKERSRALSETKVSEPYEIALTKSLTDKSLEELSAAVPFSSSPKAPRKEFYNDSTEEWSPLKLRKVKNVKDPRQYGGKQRSSVSLTEDEIRTITNQLRASELMRQKEGKGSQVKRREEQRKRLPSKKNHSSQMILASQIGNKIKGGDEEWLPDSESSTSNNYPSSNSRAMKRDIRKIAEDYIKGMSNYTDDD